MKKHLGVNGPFEISLKRAKNFGYNLYYNHCFTTTMEELEKLEIEYAEAVERSDTDLAAVKQKELEFYEAVMTAAVSSIEEERRGMLSGSLHD